MLPLCTPEGARVAIHGRQWWWVALLLILGLAPGNHVAASETDRIASQVKAAYVYKFANYIQWPESNRQAPFVVGVVDAAEMQQELSALFLRHGLAGRSVEIRPVTANDDLAGLHILFVGADQSRQLGGWLRDKDRPPLLLVSDAPGALANGSMINFVEVKRRIRFEVNQGAAERVGLKLSARLLSAAMHVQKE